MSRAGARAAQRFRADRLARVAEMERGHFWFAGRRVAVEALVRRYLPGDGSLAVDVGCGTGSQLEGLRARGLAVLGVDPRPEGLAALQRSHPGIPVARGLAVALPLPDGCAAGVLMLDVLEHVDDAAALREVARVLRPGGVLIATVPAFTWLWSYRDEDAGHLRRYTRQGLRSRLTQAGLRVEELSFYQFLLFPLVLASRWAGRGSRRVRDLEDSRLPVLNDVLAAISRWESRQRGRGIRWPWGSSIVAVARKGGAS